MPTFTSRSGETVLNEPSRAMEVLLSNGILEQSQRAPRREYLGFSRIGEECERRLGYEYHNTPKDIGRAFTGRTLRIFQRGHAGEERIKAHLRAAGFQIVDLKADGGQIGVYMLPHPATGKARLAGHIDGVITGWAQPGDWPDGDPYPLADQGALFQFPALWENKILNAKNWTKLNKEGLAKAKPVYYAQMQLYMAYLDLHEKPGIFTAENADTCEIYVELVPFNPRVAQDLSDKAVRIVESRAPEELPRVTKDATDFRCKFCDYQERCHAPAKPIAGAIPAPSWVSRLDPPKA